MSPVLRRTAPPVAHGGIDPAEIERLGLRPEDILDFSTNVNPLGPPPGLGEALLEVDPAAYPDRNALALRRALAERLAVTPDDLLVGNGSAEIIWLLALAALAPSDRVVIVGPTFGEYARAARLAGAEVVEYQAREDDAFVPDVAKVVDLVRVARPALLFVCNPNNPTGAYLGRDAVEMLLRAVGEGLLVLDEAYVRFVEDPWSATDLVSRGNLVLLRSMTKDYALAGLRLGYAVASPAVVAALHDVQPPWSVNALAQAAGLRVLEQEDHVARGRALARQAVAYLQAALATLRWPTAPTRANFLLARVGDGSAWRAQLLRRGLLVRDCRSFGLPAHVRIAARPLDACHRLIAAATAIARERRSAADRGLPYDAETRVQAVG